eukprot:363161-Chlamydomonas_euryale.AAC.1
MDGWMNERVRRWMESHLNVQNGARARQGCRVSAPVGAAGVAAVGLRLVATHAMRASQHRGRSKRRTNTTCGLCIVSKTHIGSGAAGAAGGSATSTSTLQLARRATVSPVVRASGGAPGSMPRRPRSSDAPRLKRPESAKLLPPRPPRPRPPDGHCHAATAAAAAPAAAGGGSSERLALSTWRCSRQPARSRRRTSATDTRSSGPTRAATAAAAAPLAKTAAAVAAGGEAGSAPLPLPSPRSVGPGEPDSLGDPAAEETTDERCDDAPSAAAAAAAAAAAGGLSATEVSTSTSDATCVAPRRACSSGPPTALPPPPPRRTRFGAALRTRCSFGTPGAASTSSRQVAHSSSPRSRNVLGGSDGAWPAADTAARAGRGCPGSAERTRRMLDLTSAADSLAMAQAATAVCAQWLTCSMPAPTRTAEVTPPPGSSAAPKWTRRPGARNGSRPSTSGCCSGQVAGSGKKGRCKPGGWLLRAVGQSKQQGRVRASNRNGKRFVGKTKHDRRGINEGWTGHGKGGGRQVKEG